MSPRSQKSAAYGVAKKAVKAKLLAWAAPILVPLLGILAAVLFFVAAAVTMARGNTNLGDGGGDIPTEMLAIYQSELVHQECPGLPWNYLAAIGKIETNHGRSSLPGVHSGVNFAGARGPMQFLATTWDSQGRPVVNVGRSFGRITTGGYGVDGNGDGAADNYDPYDAVLAAARYLCASGGGNPATLQQAIFAYNHSLEYVNDVVTLAKSLVAVSNCNGVVLVDAGANRPGVSIRPETMAFLKCVAALYGKPMNCTTGTNHDMKTTDGYISDHWGGNACDFGMNGNDGYDDSPVGDKMMTACLIAAGYSSQEAARLAYLGGLYTKDGVRSPYGQLRVQCIWKTYAGGNHHHHLHVGARLG